ncbi:G3E family GTPase [Psychrobacter sp. PL15]|uniref:CobW family GTP-binding protein n=1 Tax=Psychrobacter sp. PL15 TaxID=3071719 RepID=UPI002E0351AB|nr:G3E family GTPase [Psychrobacter sp. PL15]
MNASAIIQNIPCTLVTGFLGSGKTTVINQLLATKPAEQRWALLINEFGRIGVDGALLKNTLDAKGQSGGIAIREVSGGCICCTSQLPLQIAITRLLSDHHPQRLIIEPTGLAHPRELIRQLSAPHWQTALSMQAVITVLSGLQWQQEKYRTHHGFQAHVRDADVLVINRYEQLSSACRQDLQAWIATLNEPAKIIWATADSETAPEPQTTPHCQAVTNNLDVIKPSNPYLTELAAQLIKPSRTISQQRIANIEKSRVSLTPPTHLPSNMPTNANADTSIEADGQNELPYRYHEEQQGMLLAGWRLPPHWTFAADELQQWLLQLPNWQRIKGIVNTSDGWLQLNFTPDSLTITTTSAQIDSRLEIILLADSDIKSSATTRVGNNSSETKSEQQSLIEWERCDRELMALVVPSNSQP